MRERVEYSCDASKYFNHGSVTTKTLISETIVGLGIERGFFVSGARKEENIESIRFGEVVRRVTTYGLDNFRNTPDEEIFVKKVTNRYW